MKFGICAKLDQAAAVKASGWDYLEESAQALLEGQAADADWKGARRAAASGIAIRACNMLVPASLKITGPDADIAKLERYIDVVTERAAEIGVKILVFGSAGARNVPDGFDRKRARAQLLDFAAIAAKFAAKAGVTIVMEPLQRGESNIINSIAEAMTIVREINRPSFQCLVDSYHLWMENEPLENVRQAVASIRHVHVADLDGRVPPGEAGSSDYRPLFRILRDGGYAGTISVETARPFDIAAIGARVLQFLKNQWETC